MKMLDNLQTMTRLGVVIAVCLLALLSEGEGKKSKRPLLKEGCPPCDRSACPKVRRGSCSSMEITKDACGCCRVCSAGLGERCGGFRWEEGICGKGLMCAKYMMHFKARVEFGEAGTCVCSDRDTVCGADGRLYDDICHLRQLNNERKMRGESKVSETKLRTCGGAPKIKTQPQDVSTTETGQFYLACEGEGIPIPDIYWTRDRKKLPSDEDNVSVQVRGGPMKNCVTSWVMISNALTKDAGEYTCYVENNEGKANASATVSIIT